MNSDIDSLCAGIDEALSALPDEVPALHTVVLFGSLATGHARPDSDADVAVQSDRTLTAGQRMRIIESLTLLLDRPVDLVDLSVVGQPLLDRISTEGIRIRGTDQHWGGLLFRNVMDREDFLPMQQRILANRRDQWLNK
ncbi:MAG: nucleotidyltransferase domain-containing protein [Pseudohongiellaceae bacterium]